MLPVSPFYIKSRLEREYVSICVNKTRTFLGGKYNIFDTLANFFIFAAIIEVEPSLDEIPEGRLRGLPLETWLFLSVWFSMILLVVFVVQAVRKLTKVRTQTLINHSFLNKKRNDCFVECKIHGLPQAVLFI